MNSGFLAQYRSLIWLALGCLFTATLIACEWQFLQAKQPHNSVINHTIAMGSLDLPVEQADSLPPLHEFKAMVDAPLFFEGRKEVETIAVVDDGSLKLNGTILTPQGLVALLSDKQGQYFKVTRGKDIQGWLVTNIQKDRVELVRNAESRELVLFQANKQRDITAEDLEQCFKDHADLPLEECLKNPQKFADKAVKVEA